MTFVNEPVEQQDHSPEALAEIVRHRFAVDVHPRSIGRALARWKKNAEVNPHEATNIDALPKEAMVSRYEEVRGNMIDCHGIGIFRGQGLALMLHKGMAAWLRAWLKTAELPTGRL